MSSERVTRWLVVVALAALAAGSCGDSNNGANASCANGGAGGASGRDGGAGADGSAGTGGADAGEVLSDAQIAGVMIDANSGEVHAADVANGRTKTPAVRSFAALMITDHTAANHSLDMVLDAQGLFASDSGTRQLLATQAQQTLAQLWSVPRADFDLTYAMAQVTMHQMVLGLLDDTLIPQAQNAALKAALQAARMTVATHLADAEALLASLTGDGGAGDGAPDTGAGDAADAAGGG
ncbi:MAG TPA: DUF4142 domain-containing protein [Polyangia bacterium]|nr:DUF4142 domain-containing protein [Polyangia bacterium]